MQITNSSRLINTDDRANQGNWKMFHRTILNSTSVEKDFIEVNSTTPLFLWQKKAHYWIPNLTQPHVHLSVNVFLLSGIFPQIKKFAGGKYIIMNPLEFQSTTVYSWISKKWNNNISIKTLQVRQLEKSVFWKQSV